MPRDVPPNIGICEDGDEYDREAPSVCEGVSQVGAFGGDPALGGVSWTSFQTDDLGALFVDLWALRYRLILNERLHVPSYH